MLEPASKYHNDEIKQNFFNFFVENLKCVRRSELCMYSVFCIHHIVDL